MNTVERLSALTDGQREQAVRLAEACRQHDGIRLAYPPEDEPGICHYLLWEGGQLLSALAWLPMDAATAECIAFTRPDRRRQGLFSRLLEQAVEEHEDCDILFPVSEPCEDTLAALDALGAELESREYQMKKDLPVRNQRKKRRRAWTDLSGARLEMQAGEDFLTDAVAAAYYPSERAASPAGTLQTAPVSETCVCLHHVMVEEQARGRGYGTQMIRLLLAALEEYGVRSVILQVSADNAPALSVYKKTGFRITETLSYYLF